MEFEDFTFKPFGEYKNNIQFIDYHMNDDSKKKICQFIKSNSKNNITHHYILNLIDIIEVFIKVYVNNGHKLDLSYQEIKDSRDVYDFYLKDNLFHFLSNQYFSENETVIDLILKTIDKRKNDNNKIILEVIDMLVNEVF